MNRKNSIDIIEIISKEFKEAEKGNKNPISRSKIRNKIATI
jgi:hypothetical protein